MEKGRFSDVRNVPVDTIRVAPAKFQGRTGEFSEDTVKAIVARGHYDRTAEPIVLWKDKVDGHTYLLSGHSRFEAARRLRTSGKQPDLTTIPAKFLQVDDIEDAIDYAVLESNRGGTEEGLISDLRAYQRAVAQGKNRQYLLGIFKPESRLHKLQDLSHLNPKGLFIEHLAGTQAQSFPYLERNARWVGNIRAQLPRLTNAHEREMFDYFYTDGTKGLKLDKSKFYQLIENKVNRIDFDPDRALNLHDRVSASAYTDPINEAIAEVNRDIEARQKEIISKRELVVRARAEANDKLEQKFLERIDELNRDILRLTERRLQLQQQAGRLEREMVADLFSEPAPPAQSPDRLRMAKAKAAAAAARIRILKLKE